MVERRMPCIVQEDFVRDLRFMLCKSTYSDIYDIIVLGDLFTLAIYKIKHHIDAKIIRRSIFACPILVVDTLTCDSNEVDKIYSDIVKDYANIINRR